jgi:hypothetical protein
MVKLNKEVIFETTVRLTTKILFEDFRESKINLVVRDICRKFKKVGERRV